MPSQAPQFRQLDTQVPTSEPAVSAELLREALSRHEYLRHTHIASTVNDLPKAVQAILHLKGISPTAVRGAYVEGVSYLICENLSSVGEGINTALHEVVGHEGIRALLSDRFEPVMRQLYKTFPRQHDAWVTTATHYGYLDTGTDAGRIAFAEELTAHMAETFAEPVEMDMIRAEIRARLREDIPDLPVTDLEVRALIQRSREYLILRHGDPDSASYLRERQALRENAVNIRLNSMTREGKGLADPLSLALYRSGNRVLDTDNIPCRLYHGAGSEIGEIKGMFWGSTDPDFANVYAELRAFQGHPASVVPYYADIHHPFDGDKLENIPLTRETPQGLTVDVFIAEVMRQSDVSESDEELLRINGASLKQLAFREESGPTHSPQDFWYMESPMFGREGVDILKRIYHIAGFDGVRYTEQGHLTYGAFSPWQLHFIDQGATLRGWQPDRGHGEGAASKSAFDRWFGDSKAVDAAGKPLRVYHGTGGDFTRFGTGRGAIYTTPDTAVASDYALDNEMHDADSASSVMPLYLSLQNPLELDEAWAVENLDYDGVREWGGLDNTLYAAEEAGYDGAILRGVVDYAGLDDHYNRLEKPYDQYIVFRSEQIKSALCNRGTYDPRNPDIRFALKESSPSTEPFASWFGQSKVVDSEGVPVVVYRGLDADVTVMTPNEKGLIWVTPDPSYASDPHYGGKPGGVVYPLYAKVENLFDTSIPSHAEMLREKKSPLFRQAASGDFRALSDPDVIDFIKQNGFDGLTAIEPEGHPSLAVFSPQQLKTAIGTRGSNNPDARFKREDVSFEQWFKGSQVVDDRMEPLTLYHGTREKGITTLRGNLHPVPGPGDKYDWSGEQEVIHFTSRKSVAMTYGKNVHAVHLALRNPLVIDAQGKRWGADIVPLSYLPEALRKGHDGIIIRNIIDVGSGSELADTYMAFSTEQVKSASHTIKKRVRMATGTTLNFSGEDNEIHSLSSQGFSL